MKKNKPDIVYWDIENSHSLVLSFGLYPDAIPHDNILMNFYLYCVAWKHEGQKKTNVVSLLDDIRRFKKDTSDDKHVIMTIYNVLKEADYIVAHNGDNFDIKKFNTRLIYHGLPPLPPVKQIDTLKIAKRYFKFESNRLDALAKFLGVGKKMDNPKDLWIRAWQGDRKALKHMTKYCKQDVDVLQEVYHKLAPYDHSSPLNMNFFNGETSSCPNCGSLERRNIGYHYTRVSRYQRWQCDNCNKCYQERGADPNFKVEVK